MPEPTRSIDVRELLGEASWVRGLAVRMLGDEHAADDVVQDTWVAALERGPRTSGGAGLRAWLATVARNFALKRGRAEATRRLYERQAARAEATAGPGHEVERMQLQRRLAEAILGLAEPYRSTVILRFLDGLTPAQIAARKSVSPAAVRQRLSRALAMLRARLEGEEGIERSAWALFVPGFSKVGGASSPAAALSLGGIVMSSKLTVAAAALALAALSTVILLSRSSGEEVGADVPVETAAAEVALVPDRPATSAPDLEEAGPATLPRRVAAEAIAPAETAFVFAGRVESSRGEPLEGARVSIVSEEDVDGAALEVESDAGGRFRLSLAGPRAAVDLRATRAGYVEATISAAVDGAAGDVVLVLQALPSIEGQVRDRDGAPVSPPGKVGVVVEDVATREQREVTAEIGADGRFVISSVPVGRAVSAWALVRGFPEHDVLPELRLEPDRVEQLDFALPSGAVVTGVVIDSVTRDPVPGARVWSDSMGYDGESLRPTTVADAAGRFELAGVAVRRHVTDEGAVMGFLHVIAGADGYAETPTRGFGDAWNDALRYDFEVELVPAGCAVRGVVLDPDGRERVAGAYVYAVDSKGNSHIVLTGGDGRFDFEGLPAGPFGVLARSGEIEGGRSLGAARDLELAAGAETECRLVLAEPGGRLAGTVVGPAGAPAPGCEVEARLIFQSNNLAMQVDGHRARTDELGRYHFERMPAGLYDVAPLPTPQQGGCASPITRKFELALDEHQGEVDFTIGPCIELGGRVEAATRPFGTLRVRLVGADGTEIDDTEPGEDGAFRFDPVLAELYELRVTAGDEILSATAVGPQAAPALMLRAP